MAEGRRSSCGDLVPMMTALGVEARWEVIAGTQEFFVVVKRLTDALQGRDEKITEDMYQTYPGDQ